MPKNKKSDKKPTEQYDHKGKDRLNNPPVGLVTPETDRDSGKKKYAYDPHLAPQLYWAGKAEHTSFEVPTVSLHVHERIDPRTIIEAVRKKNGNGGPIQESLFASMVENPPLREAIEFYKHKHNWSNRLIAGDSLLVMNSLIEKEGLAGQVQMIYIDPPYGIDYGSNFQPFINNKTVIDGQDGSLTSEPEMLRAFRDTWELGIHSYLTYLRDRFYLSREMLSDTGCIFVQISSANLHHVRELLDEIFDNRNFISILTYRTRTMPMKSKLIDVAYDHIVWYGKDKSLFTSKFKPLFIKQDIEGDSNYRFIEFNDGSRREMTTEEINNHKLLPKGSKVYRLHYLKPSQYRPNQDFNFEFEGELFPPPGGNISKTPDGVHSWATTPEGMAQLVKAKRLQKSGSTLQYILYHYDYPVTPLNSVWIDTASELDKKYVVQTSELPIQRCILMSTNPGDLVFDPTCGSGTTPYVAEQWGRRWITCDTSRVSITLAKQRLMTSLFDYYELAHPNEGVGSGFKYKMVPHVTLGSIANNEPPDQETLYDQPFMDNKKARVTGPFTVEAVPAPLVKPLSDIDEELLADKSIARSGETLRQEEWRDELLKTGIRGKGGQKIEFSRVEPLPGTRWLHADAETKEGNPQRVVVSFGPEHAPLEQRQVALAIEEAQSLVPKPKIIVFASFQFDPEASKDIDELNWPGVTLLKALMNADLLTDDLKKKRSSNESFWLIGQPDIRLEKIKEGKDKGKYQVSVVGFDYYNTRTGTIESGGTEKIALWMLDTDYDGRSLFPRQVFFPMSGEKDGWSRLAKNLKAEIDEDLIEVYRGSVSLPFEAGGNKRIAIKIVDDRGIESLKIIGI